MDEDNYKRARSLLLPLAKKGSRYDRAEAFKLLGICYFKLGGRASARKAFERALRLDPEISLTPRDTRSLGAFRLFKSVRSEQRVGRSSGYRRARRERAGVSRGKAPGALVVAPFGIPQFIQGKSILGSFFALTQVSGILLFFERGQFVKDTEVQREEVIFEQESSGSFSEEDYNNYLSTSEENIESAKSLSQVGLILFLGSYVGNIVEAYINPAKPPVRRRRRYSEYRLLDLKPGISYLESIYSSPAHEVKHSLNAKLISTEGIPQPGIEWTYSF